MILPKALFLDRDGIINKDNNFVFKKEDFIFYNPIFEIIRIFKNRGFKIIIITNQSGIGRGLFSETDFQEINKWMLNVFHDKNLDIDRVYYCPYHPTQGSGKYLLDHNNRKPNPGMIFEAKKDFNLDLKNSILIGDRMSDISAGLSANVGNLFLINKMKPKTSIDQNKFHYCKTHNEAIEVIKNSPLLKD